MLAIYECTQFIEQTVIHAMPDILEFQEISSVLPQGIGPIGIYHSHPSLSDIFHSHTDDSTLISLTNQFQDCISIITNGQNTKFYQMGKNYKTKEIEVEYIEPEVPKFMLVSINEKFEIFIDPGFLTQEKSLSKLNIQIQNLIINYFQNNWNELEFTHNNSTIGTKDKLHKYLVEKLNTEPLRLKIPSNLKQRHRDLLKVIQKDIKDDTVSYEAFEFIINTKFPLYNIRKYDNFDTLNQKVKDEFLGNNLIQKLHNLIIDKENLRIIIPNDYYLKFFGFYIRTLNFNKKNLNEILIKNEPYKFELKIIRFLKSFINLEVSIKFKNYLYELLNNLEDFAEHFTWKEKLSEDLKQLKINLK